MSELGALLDQLQGRGHEIDEREDARALVRLGGRDSTFVLLAADEWLQVAAVLIEADDIVGTPGEDALPRELLRINSRYLGGRFAYDDDGVRICTDVYPGHVTAPHVEEVMEQMDYIAGVLLPLFKVCLSSGGPIDDGAVDAAFEPAVRN